MSNPWELTDKEIIAAQGEAVANSIDNHCPDEVVGRYISRAANRKLVEWLKRYTAGVDSTGFQRFTLAGQGWILLCQSLGVLP
jgi:hypothetical protein